MDTVARHLRRWATVNFEWGRTDCALVLADYVLDVLGQDGAAHLRGRYSTRLECERACGLVSRGLVAIVGECAAVVSLQPTPQPERGDIGVLQFAERVFAGGLCLGDNRWAVKSPDGLLTPTNPNVVAAWAVQG